MHGSSHRDPDGQWLLLADWLRPSPVVEFHTFESSAVAQRLQTYITILPVGYLIIFKHKIHTGICRHVLLSQEPGALASTGLCPSCN